MSTTATTEVKDTSSKDNNDDIDEDINRMSEIESVCMHCYENGTTRMLISSIPYFRDVIVMSFECPHCHWKNNEIQPANSLADKAVTYTLTVKLNNPEDMNRQVIKSECAIIRIPEFDFEVPANSTRGEINTVEGIVNKFADALDATYLQTDNGMDEETKAKVTILVDNFRKAAKNEIEFTLIVEDPTGNSYIENPNAPKKDPSCIAVYTERTREENIALGYAVKDQTDDEIKQQQDAKEQAEKDNSQDIHMSVDYDRVKSSLDTYFDVTSNTAIIPSKCPHCQAPAETRMCLTDIPFFKEIIIMVTDCASCGWRDSEVKPGGAVSDKACKTTLKVTCSDDLKRDMLKSDTAGIFIPEIELEMTHGSLGGKYTTVEGILTDIKTQLTYSNPFALGDSSAASEFGHQQQVIDQMNPIAAFKPTGNDERKEINKGKMLEFLSLLDECIEGKRLFTLILDDPMNNSFIDSVIPTTEHNMGDNDNNKNDPNIVKEYYERTFEQNEELGLNDINTENYENKNINNKDEDGLETIKE